MLRKELKFLISYFPIDARDFHTDFYNRSNYNATQDYFNHSLQATCNTSNGQLMNKYGPQGPVLPKNITADKLILKTTKYTNHKQEPSMIDITKQATRDSFTSEIEYASQNRNNICTSNEQQKFLSVGSDYNSTRIPNRKHEPQGRLRDNALYKRMTESVDAKKQQTIEDSLQENYDLQIFHPNSETKYLPQYSVTPENSTEYLLKANNSMSGNSERTRLTSASNNLNCSAYPNYSRGYSLSRSMLEEQQYLPLLSNQAAQRNSKKNAIQRKKQQAIEKDRLLQSIRHQSDDNSEKTADKIYLPKIPYQIAREGFTNKSRLSERKKGFSLQEDQKIVKYYQEYGNNYKEIARHLPGRTDGMVSNRLNTLMKKRKPELFISDESNPGSISMDNNDIEMRFNTHQYDLMSIGEQVRPDLLPNMKNVPLLNKNLIPRSQMETYVEYNDRNVDGCDKFLHIDPESKDMYAKQNNRFEESDLFDRNSDRNETFRRNENGIEYGYLSHETIPSSILGRDHNHSRVREAQRYRFSPSQISDGYFYKNSDEVQNIQNGKSFNNFINYNQDRVTDKKLTYGNVNDNICSDFGDTSVYEQESMDEEKEGSKFKYISNGRIPVNNQTKQTGGVSSETIKSNSSLIEKTKLNSDKLNLPSLVSLLKSIEMTVSLTRKEFEKMENAPR